MQSAQTIRELAKIEEGIPLWGCIPDSPSARAGLRYGDIIVRIGGHRVKDVRDYIKAMKARLGTEIAVEVLRNGECHMAVLIMADDAPSRDFEETAKYIAEQRMLPPIDDEE